MQRHGETERRHEGFEARLEQLFETIEAHSREVIIGGVALLLLGGLAAGLYEWRQSSINAAQLALDQVDWTYLEAMGGRRDDLYPVEPANEAQARSAREEALAGYEQVIEEHGGVAAEIAQIRAAEVEVGLGRLEAADQRLTGASDDISEGALRATALRLHGFVLEELLRPLDAAARYEAAAAIESYPAPEDLWIIASEARVRGGDPAGAANDLREVLGIAPEYAERLGLVERLESVEALASDAAPPPADAD
jgi:hypothetical protein